MLCIVRTKACKRCGGDISLECDIYGVYVECIQCGANWSGKDIIAVHAQATQKNEEYSKTKTVKTLVKTGLRH